MYHHLKFQADWMKNEFLNSFFHLVGIGKNVNR